MEEALAIQMALKDDQLQEWRKMIQILRVKETAKKEAKSKEKNSNEGVGTNRVYLVIFRWPG